MNHALRLLFLFLVFPVAWAKADDPNGTPSLFKRLKYRSIGPGAGGRVSRACGVPGDPLTFYAATSAGGVWKSSDGGINWNPIFDDQPMASIGAIAVAPSDPNVIYVGSGEANIRGNVSPGNGIYKSEDTGKTWKHVWKQIGQIGTVVIDPKNADIAYAAVLGNAFGPNEERGVYRTTDGGKNWKRVLFKDKDTGASDVALDPSSPRMLLAGLWQTRRKPWEYISGGPGSGLYISHDGGDTWTQLIPESATEGQGRKHAKGLPEGIWGKVCVAIAPSDGRRVYAMIEAEKGGLFRSDDGGVTWSNVNDSRGLRQRPWYFSTFTVHPTNPDVLYFPQVPLLKSLDGGKTLERVKGPHHGDHHDIWIDPKNPKRIIDSNDGGVDITVNGGDTWFAPLLPIAQFYRIDVDNHVPYRVMGSMQDIGTCRGPSNSLTGGIQLSDWLPVGGGEAGHVVVDPSDPAIVYAGEYGGVITRFDFRTQQSQNVGIYPFNPSGHDPKNLKFRFQWTAPIMISPHDPRQVYHAANVLFTSNDEGRTWRQISADLTRNDRSKQNWSGGPITGDNTGVEIYCTIFAIAESPLKKGLLWVGTDDGQVWVSLDAGKQWELVTPKGMPEWATVQTIEPSPFDPDTAYLVAHNYRLDDPKPYLFQTTDHGKTWKSLTATLPKDDWLHCVRCDPKKKGLLFLGSELGLSYSADDGTTWRPLKLNLPTVCVNDLKVKDNDLVVGTSGRSLWILDDLTPLREASSGSIGEPVAFMPPQPATRWRLSSKLEDRHPFKGFDNPPEGAALFYYLKEKPKGDITLDVLDSSGKKIAGMSSKEQPPPPKREVREGLVFQDEGSYSSDRYKPERLTVEPGLQRYVWDLRHDGARIIRGARMDSGQAQEGPVAKPGQYTLRLTVEDKVLTRMVELKPDPRLKMTAEAYSAQEQFALKVRDDISRLTDMVHRLRLVRQQIQDRDDVLGDDAKPLIEAGKELVKKLDALEEKLHNPKAKTVYDILAQKGGAKLYSQLGWISEQVKESDGPIVQGVKTVYEEQMKVFKGLEGEWKSLLETDLAKLNEQAKKLDAPAIVVPTR
jgi:photosystem II stability/assembly factor-like uncharacterized protein